MTDATSSFTAALVAIAEGKEDAESGSGTTWLLGLQEAIALDLLDSESPLIVSTALNGKSDAFLHDMTRPAKLEAIRSALRSLAGTTGSRRVHYATFSRTRFY